MYLFLANALESEVYRYLESTTLASHSVESGSSLCWIVMEVAALHSIRIGLKLTFVCFCFTSSCPPHPYLHTIFVLKFELVAAWCCCTA